MSSNGLSEKLRDRIRKSDLWCDRSKATHSHFSGLRCPECGKTEAWVYVERPFSINCNRKNECGVRVRTLDLFPDVLVNIEKDYAPTKADPNRPARAFLLTRGLSQSLVGLDFQFRKNIRKTASGGVMFHVGKSAAGKDVWNGRLFNPPPGEGKTHNKGETVGLFWKHPHIEYDPKRPTYVTEGIIDALSLIEMGLQAIAVLAAGQDPSRIDLGDLAGNLVLAFDPDTAGAGGLKKWKAHHPDAKAVTPISGDWNDFLRSQPPGKAAGILEEKLPEFEARASLLLAETAHDYADVYREFYGYPPGLFAFDRKYWYSTAKASKNGDGALSVYRVSNFTLSVDHYQLDASNDDEPVYRYYLKIRPKSGQPISCSVTGSELSTPGSIRSTLLTRARVMWEGEARPSAALANRIVEAGAPVVRQVHIVGHDIKSGCLVFRDFLIDPAGKIILPDKQGFFRASRKEFLRPPAIPTLKPKNGTDPKEIYRLINAAWPDNGALAYAFTFASWFANSIKPELGFFPFFSLHGDTQTGKTRLVRVLNALQCFDEEGLPMTKLNTGKGEIRKLAQRSGLFKALLEGNKEDKLRFDLESLLTLYNYGNHLQVRAVKSNDIRTQETSFLGSLIFVQNREPFKGKAQLERVVSSRPFRSEDITAETTEAFNRLVRIPPRELAYSYVYIMRNRQAVEADWTAEYTAAREQMFSAILDNRLSENYGIILAFHRILTKILRISLDLKPFIIELAQRKHEQCSARQATLADSFFEAINELSDETRDKFVEIKDDQMMVKLPLALKTLDGHGYRFIQAQVMNELKEHPAFIENRMAYRGYFASTVSSTCRVWRFDLSKII